MAYHKAPIRMLSTWEPPEYIPKEVWYYLEVEGIQLCYRYMVSDHGRVYNPNTERLVRAEGLGWGVEMYRLRAVNVDTYGSVVTISQGPLRRMFRDQKPKPFDTVVYPYKPNKPRMAQPRTQVQEPKVEVKPKPEVLKERTEQLAAKVAFPDPHSQDLPWMKITPEELTVVRMMLASLEDHEAVHVVQAARQGLKRLLEENP